MAENDAGNQPAGPEHDETTVLPENAGVADANELQRIRDAAAAAQAELEEFRDRYLRSVAELDNIRKRAAREVEQAQKFAVEKLAAELLPVIDSLELAVAHGASSDLAAVLAGQQSTLKLLQKAFEKFSIRPVDPLGKPFDPQLHEAMAVREVPTAEPDSVVEVIQRGYELNGRLLRPARVIVAKSPG